MNIKNFTILTLFLFLSVGFSLAQTDKLSAPRQEKLLNGLKLLTWNEPNAEKVTVKLRIHSGSAFDPQAKEGTMALLSDILFPDDAAKEFFREDLGGSIDIESNYDYVQITATANSDQFLTMLETIANAVTKPQIDKEITAKVISARLAKVKELEKNPAYIADLAVAKRLYGDFPYGRAQTGTSESLTKIDFADLLFARQRFLTPDNATLAVVGKVKSDLVNRAVRRYFGAWEKSDKKVPATFAQPETPNTEVFKISLNNLEKEFFRNASEGFSRNDKDYYSNVIITKVWQSRLSKFPNLFFKYEPHLLRGIIVWGFSSTDDSDANNENKTEVKKQENKKVIKSEEFEKAKAELLNELNLSNVANWWLDVDTYKLVSVKDELQKVNSITSVDVQRVFDKLQKEPSVTVFIEKIEEKK
ncbi:MAG: M16 family metallopeptidase [Pyrinomonadaceae bacterium]